MRKLPDSLSPPANFLARHSAIIALALFAAVGIAVLDDYGISADDEDQRQIRNASFDYILGDETALIEGHHNRYYGVAFEVPLIAVNRLLNLEDSRDVHLTRHLLTHLLFLAGGFFAWLLTYRLFGSRLVAMLAMLLFLLHPRIYAHSFFNTKDLPFLSMFMIALYLIHRAFRRDTVWAFALCGVGVGLLANIRIMGVILIPAVLGMLALDVFYTMKRGGGGVKHILANICVFSTICAATLYAAWPLLWRDPFEALNALRVLSEHPTHYASLFRGERVQWPNLPWDYIPTWILITTPPVALILAALGIGYIARLCAADRRDALANSTARFGLLALACLILPVAAVIALNFNVYSDWRHTYFLYAPMCVLAAFGLRALAALPKPRLRVGAFAPVALGIAVVAVQMVRLHPLQSDYFSPLMDKSELADRYAMDYWHVSLKDALDALLEMRPTGRIAVSAAGIHAMRNRSLIPRDDRRRLFINPDFPQFRVAHRYGGENVLWEREIYGVPVVSIVDVRAESKAAFQDAFAAVKSSGWRLAGAGGFEIYRNGQSLAYINEAGGDEDPDARLDLKIIPLRAGEDGADGESRRLDLWRYATFDGKTIIPFDLPDYPVRAVETAMRTAGDEGALWSARADFYAAALSEPPSEPAASAGGFDIYRNGGALTYVKENCDEDDTRGRFFLSVFPSDPSDLPQTARDAGHEHESLNFDFARYGAIVDGNCSIIRYLPSYPISRVETGQWIPDEGELWRADIAVGD